MGEIYQFGPNHAHAWRRYEDDWRQRIASKGLSPEKSDQAFVELRGYHAKLFAEDAIKFHMSCPESFSEVQVESMQKGIDALMLDYERMNGRTMANAMEIIIDLLAEKYR